MSAWQVSEDERAERQRCMDYLREVCGNQTDMWYPLETDAGEFQIRIVKSDGTLSLMSQDQLVRIALAAKGVFCNGGRR
jgi:hypothetical protein